MERQISKDFFLIEKYKVQPENLGHRLSDLPSGTFTSKPSRKSFKKAIDSGLVFINGIKAKTASRLKQDDVISIYDYKSEASPDLSIPIKILYQDNYLAVIFKPAGINVRGNQSRTIENQLEHHLQKSEQKDRWTKARAAHRLDRDTSGCLIISKTVQSSERLDEMFKSKQIQKTYIAVTQGIIEESQLIINQAIQSKESTSYLEVLHKKASDKYQELNLVKLQPKTGRTHQLRIHTRSINAPIVGDKIYGFETSIKGQGLFLHAYSLEFVHPITKEPINVNCPLPKKFYKLFPKLASYLK